MIRIISHGIFILIICFTSASLRLVAFEKSPELKQLLFIVLVSAITFFIIICISPTKCYWYDVPLFPLLALVTGYFIWKVVGIINTQIEGKMAFCTLIFALFFPAIYYAVKRSYNNQIPQQERKLEILHEFFMNNGNEFKNQKLKVITADYISPMLFYKYKLKQYNTDLVICNANDLESGDKVVVGSDSIKTILEKNNSAEIAQIYKQATVYKIK
jgi:hypothetical protein